MFKTLTFTAFALAVNGLNIESSDPTAVIEPLSDYRVKVHPTEDKNCVSKCAKRVRLGNTEKYCKILCKEATPESVDFIMPEGVKGTWYEC